MQSLVLLCFCCPSWLVHTPAVDVGHPDAAYYYPHPHSHHGRHPRDLTWERSAGVRDESTAL